MLLPGFATSSSSSSFHLFYSALSSLGSDFSFPLCLHFFTCFLPVSLHLLPPSSPLFCPLRLHSFHFKTYIGADTRLPIPCSTELAVWKKEAAIPSRTRQSSVSVLFLNMHLNMADQRSKRNLWVLSAGSS